MGEFLCCVVCDTLGLVYCHVCMNMKMRCGPFLVEAFIQGLDFAVTECYSLTLSIPIYSMWSLKTLKEKRIVQQPNVHLGFLHAFVSQKAANKPGSRMYEPTPYMDAEQ